MILKIKARNDGTPAYGVTPFDIETGESLGAIFGTRIFASFDLAHAYAEREAAKIVDLGDAAVIEIIG